MKCDFMRSKFSTRTGILIAIGIVVLVILAFSRTQSTDSNATLMIHAPSGVIHAIIAATAQDQSRGLGLRDSMPGNEGMLFPFRDPGSYGFWMKDMRFPLDMVWVDQNKAVIGVTPDIPPDSYPNTFFPSRPISYVLELNAGQAIKYGIATGTKLTF